MLFFLLWLFHYMGLCPPPVYSVRWVWYPTQQPQTNDNASDPTVEGQALGACTYLTEDSNQLPRRESAG